ncbi:hypothetical protein BG015_005893, partial [Linnemannia schmuckeri]
MTTFTLERQHSAFSFIQNRRNKESKAQVLHLPNSKHDPHATASSPASSSVASTPVLPSRQGNGRIEGRAMASASGSSTAASAALTAAAAAAASLSLVPTSSSAGGQRNGHVNGGGDAAGASQDQEDDGFNDDDLLMEMENAINNVGDIQGDDGDDEDDDEDEEMEEVLTPVILPTAMPSAPVILAPASYSSAVPGGRGVNSNKPAKKPVVDMPKTPAERAAAFAK